MPDQTEFLTVMFEVNTYTNQLCDAVEAIIADTTGETIEVPIDALTALVSTLRMQAGITARTIEQNATIMDSIESAVEKLKP